MTSRSSNSNVSLSNRFFFPHRSKGSRAREYRSRNNGACSSWGDDATGCTVLGRLSADAEPGLSRATLSRPLPPAPTRGRQSLRALVPHCRRSWSNSGARTSGHLYGARDGARSDKRIQAFDVRTTARGFLPSRRGSLHLVSFSPSVFLGWPRDLKVSTRIRHTAGGRGVIYRGEPNAPGYHAARTERAVNESRKGSDVKGSPQSRFLKISDSEGERVCRGNSSTGRLL